ncbi:MAG: S16 family serine protease [Acidimicrobiales bacterium]
MTSTDIEEGTGGITLPPRPGDGAVARRRPGALRVAVVAALLLATTVVGAAVLPVPYVALRPGSARAVSEQVLVRDAPSYKPEESIAYTTVNVGGTTLLEAIQGWLDDDVDVLPEQRIRGDRTDAENRRYNAQLMDNSKLVAITVALEHLGHKVPIRTTGTVVRQIVKGSPADGVLRLDDVVVAVDRQSVDQPGKIGTLLQPGGPGAQHTLSVERPAGSRTTRDVTIATIAAPDDPTRAVIGIAPEDRIVGFDFPIDVTIDSGNVGGPSAGLAFTLAVLDVLTPGEITGGHRVAVTGTMALDGTVGPVGGAAQKAITVRDAGYEVFLVPSDELAEVRATVGDDLKVIAVDTLAEALDALGSLGGNAGSLGHTGDASGP